jgi:class 3 adenylate cyclase
VQAERRQVTVLFTDMVGFTSFSERAGEEAAYTLMRGLSKLMDGAVREQGGIVQSFTGDGIMAVFGAPVAFEDAPLRACRAALSMLQRLKTAAPDLEVKHGLQPQLRIGLNTGVAVVGKVQEGAEAQITVLGDTVNLASRVQALAEPNSVFMSEAMLRLVEGLVDASFAGEHAIKGKAELQKVYRLDAVRHGATRFEAAVSRGLSVFVGREHELEVLDRELDEARSKLCVIDLAAEPGMGKSRLVHEFRQRIDKERAFVLLGSCSRDGQHTPFLPFIEVVRGAFRISAGEAENDIAQKLEMGLTTLGLHSNRNLGLLLNLLGLKVPDDALKGLDGVLIGLRTRELLQQLLEARCGLSPVVMLVEDLHWIDSASEELLHKIVDSDAKLRLLLLMTRRPEYSPPWLDCAGVTKLRLEPLGIDDIRRLVRARLEILPEPLVLQVAEKAEGNPLFAEEIVSFLAERGMVRSTPGKLDFDATVVATALPASIESLLSARVDRLAHDDRALLQAASVIGRRFNPELLAAAIGKTNVDTRLEAMQALGLVRFEAKSSDCVFKHALVRDALYQSLLGEARNSLHLKIADEIERRSGNRVAEVVEVLAHHYSKTECADKACTYLALAGNKSLGVYSLDEASNYLAAASQLLRENPDCVSDEQVADLISDYVMCLHLSARLESASEIVARFKSRLDRLGDDPKCILVQHHYVMALFLSGKFREAERAQTNLSAMAARLNDARSRAYALASAIQVSTVLAPYPVEDFELICREANSFASNVDDAYIQCFIRYALGWDEMHRGRMAKAREAAKELLSVGRRMNDPRSTGFGMQLEAWIALTSDDYSAALKFAETGVAIARAPIDHANALTAKYSALVLLRRPEAFSKLRDWMQQCAANGWGYMLVAGEGLYGVTLVLRGQISAGILWMEQSISRREREGYRSAADWNRMFMCEMYLEIVSGKKRPPAKVLVPNMLTLASVMFTAEKRICALIGRVRQNSQFDSSGHHVGRCEMILGLLYKTKKKRALALQHLTEAKRILSQFGQTPILARVETALAELGQ